MFSIQWHINITWALGERSRKKEQVWMRMEMKKFYPVATGFCGSLKVICAWNELGSVSCGNGLPSGRGWCAGRTAGPALRHCGDWGRRGARGRPLHNGCRRCCCRRRDQDCWSSCSRCWKTAENRRIGLATSHLASVTLCRAAHGISNVLKPQERKSKCFGVSFPDAIPPLYYSKS